MILETWQKAPRIIDLDISDQEILEQTFAKFSHCQLLAIRELLLILAMNKNSKEYLISEDDAERKKEDGQDWHFCPVPHGFCDICDDKIVGLTQ